MIGPKAADVEAEFPPGDQLVEKPLGTAAYPPPPGAAAVGWRNHVLGRPALVAHGFEKHLVRRDVTEMEVGRQAARRLRLRPVTVIKVAPETMVEKSAQGGVSGRRTATDGSGGNGVVDRQRRQRVDAAG
jgi:hypothetical protein